MAATTVDILLFLALALACAVGLLLAVLQMPGTWLMVVSAAGYAWHYDWERIGTVWLLVLAGIAAMAEVAETLSGVVAAKRGGASRRASWYGLFGGIIGAVCLTVPVPLVGTIIGAAIGCFAGALLAELQLGQGVGAGARSGAYAAIGRTLGSIMKILAGLVIAGIVIVRAAWNALT